MEQSKKIIAVFGAVNSSGLYITPNVAVEDDYTCPCCEQKVEFHNGKIIQRYFKHHRRTELCGAYSKNVTQKDIERLLLSRVFKDHVDKEFIRIFKANEKVSVVYKCKNRDDCLIENGTVLHSEIYDTQYLKVDIVKNTLAYSIYTIYNIADEPIFNQVLYIGSIQNIHLNDAPMGYIKIEEIEEINEDFISNFFKTAFFKDTNTSALQLITNHNKCDVCIENSELFRKVVGDKEYLTMLDSRYPTDVLKKHFQYCNLDLVDSKYAEEVFKKHFKKHFKKFKLKSYGNTLACLGFELEHFDVIEYENTACFRYDLIDYFHTRLVHGNLKIDTNFNRSHFSNLDTPESRRNSYNELRDPFHIYKYETILVLDTNYLSNEYCQTLFKNKILSDKKINPRHNTSIPRAVHKSIKYTRVNIDLDYIVKENAKKVFDLYWNKVDISWSCYVSDVRHFDKINHNTDYFYRFQVLIDFCETFKYTKKKISNKAYIINITNNANIYYDDNKLLDFIRNNQIN